MVLLRKSCPFKLVKYKDVTSNSLSILLKSVSNQELEIAFVYNPNDEADKISNLSKALDQLASNGCKNQLIIGDYNTSLNPELDYVDDTQDPHKATREFYMVSKETDFLLMYIDFCAHMILATSGKSTTL